MLENSLLNVDLNIISGYLRIFSFFFHFVFCFGIGLYIAFLLKAPFRIGIIFGLIFFYILFLSSPKVAEINTFLFTFFFALAGDLAGGAGFGYKAATNKKKIYWCIGMLGPFFSGLYYLTNKYTALYFLSVIIITIGIFLSYRNISAIVASLVGNYVYERVVLYFSFTIALYSIFIMPMILKSWSILHSVVSLLGFTLGYSAKSSFFFNDS